MTDASSARELIVAALPSVVAVVGGEEFKIKTIKDDPATVWLRLWNQNCTPADRLYLKVGTPTVKETQHVQHARQTYVPMSGGRFSVFLISTKEVQKAFSTAKPGSTVLLRVTCEAR